MNLTKITPACPFCSFTNSRTRLSFSDRSLQGSRPQDALQGELEGEHDQSLRARQIRDAGADAGSLWRGGPAPDAPPHGGRLGATPRAPSSHGGTPGTPRTPRSPWPSGDASTAAMSAAPGPARSTPGSPWKLGPGGAPAPAGGPASKPWVWHERPEQDVRHDGLRHRQVQSGHLSRYLHVLPAHVLDHLPAPERRRRGRPGLPASRVSDRPRDGTPAAHRVVPGSRFPNKNPSHNKTTLSDGLQHKIALSIKSIHTNQLGQVKRTFWKYSEQNKQDTSITFFLRIAYHLRTCHVKPELPKAKPLFGR